MCFIQKTKKLSRADHQCAWLSRRVRGGVCAAERSNGSHHWSQHGSLQRTFTWADWRAASPLCACSVRTGWIPPCASGGLRRASRTTNFSWTQRGSRKRKWKQASAQPVRTETEWSVVWATLSARNVHKTHREPVLQHKNMGSMIWQTPTPVTHARTHTYSRKVVVCNGSFTGN